jgi:hypothetical protein
VIPIWTVAKKSEGWFASARATEAFSFPSSARWRNRAFLAATIAISDIASNPLARIKIKINPISTTILILLITFL